MVVEFIFGGSIFYYYRLYFQKGNVANNQGAVITAYGHDASIVNNIFKNNVALVEGLICTRAQNIGINNNVILDNGNGILKAGGDDIIKNGTGAVILVKTMLEIIVEME